MGRGIGAIGVKGRAGLSWKGGEGTAKKMGGLELRQTDPRGVHVNIPAQGRRSIRGKLREK